MSQPTMMLETVYRCVCLNEGCDDREIPPDRVVREIDRFDGLHRTYAHCEGCDRLYVAIRRLRDGEWAVPEVHVVDGRERESVMKKIGALHGDRYVKRST